MLDENGDVVIENGDIQMTNGTELTMQTIKTVLKTQKGEWFFNADEGINLNEILGKKRYASQNSALDNQYMKEIAAHETESQKLAARLARRLDGET